MGLLFESSELPIYTISEQVIRLTIQVKPSSSKNDIQGVIKGRLKVSLTAHPCDGLANQALITYLSKRLGIRKQEISIIKGLTSPLKLLVIPLFAKDKLDELINEVC